MRFAAFVRFTLAKSVTVMII